MVIGISLGDRVRDFDIILEDFLGETVHIIRRGTDGDIKRFAQLMKSSDGGAHVIGLGGLDLWLWCGEKRYTWREAKILLKNVKRSYIVDGSGMKNTLERLTIRYLQNEGIVDFKNSNTLLVCGVDRFGMAETIWEQGGSVVYGDLMFGLGVPFPIRSLRGLHNMARIMLPIVTKMPIRWLYPVGKKQKEIVPMFGEHYRRAHVICGDNHYIHHNMPVNLSGKIIVTNTTTSEDISDYRDRGVKLVVTTTPSLGGRTPGTNIFEAAVVAVLNKNPADLTAADYEKALREMNWKPNLIEL